MKFIVLLSAMLISTTLGASAEIVPRAAFPDEVLIGSGWPPNFTSGCVDRHECVLPNFRQSSVGPFASGKRSIGACNGNVSGCVPVRGRDEPTSLNADVINRLTNYEVIVGRAIACGVNTDEAARAIGDWFDKYLPAGSQDRVVFLPIFQLGVRYHAELQQSGKSPDNCDEVRRVFQSMEW